MPLPHISPADAKTLLANGAVLVDIRDHDEHSRERIALSRNVPLSKLCEGTIGANEKVIVFHCRSGNRTRMNSALLAKAAAVDAYILDGGLDAWKKAGFPVMRDAKQPIEIRRQAQIATGGLALLGAVMGHAVNPVFYLVSGLVGAGQMFSGITGNCNMARILKLMPWNRVAG